MFAMDSLQKWNCSAKHISQLSSSSMPNGLNQYDNFHVYFSEYLRSVCSTYEPLKRIIEQLADFEKNFAAILLEAHWFPGVFKMFPISLVLDISSILSHTRPSSKNRTNQIDRLLLSYFTPNQLNKIKRRLSQLSLPSWKKKMICEAINNYQCRRYASTVSLLICLWEGILAEKAGDFEREQRPKDNWGAIIEENNLSEYIFSYYIKGVLNNCRSSYDIQEGIPGRHAYCHGWHKEYPKKKVALNAIIITDFLLCLKSPY